MHLTNASERIEAIVLGLLSCVCVCSEDHPKYHSSIARRLEVRSGNILAIVCSSVVGDVFGKIDGQLQQSHDESKPEDHNNVENIPHYLPQDSEGFDVQVTNTDYSLQMKLN